MTRAGTFRWQAWLLPLVLGFSAALGGGDLSAEDAPSEFTAADVAFFEKKIRPVLVERCYACHSAAAAKTNKLKGGLRLDSRAGLLRGGDSGPAIVPGDAENSELLKALRYESSEMPPDGKLPDQTIADFVKWIERGAADPRKETDAGGSQKQIDIGAGRQHWAYRPLQATAAASVLAPHESWGGDSRVPSDETPPATGRGLRRNSIDDFIFSGLIDHRLKPADEAERSVLIRRLYFDLIGLPPTPEEIAGFLDDETPDAYERLVDRLLASPHFGERWGRHWLSVARFAESVTLRGFLFPEAWRYRDYVIETFNDDRPFDRFVIEQVAGDLLDAASVEQRQRQVVATTFLALGNINLEEQDKEQLRMDVVDEQLEAIGKGFLAQTLGCARCHDHKFDPIPTADYYALAGILANAKTLEHANVSKWLELPLPLPPDQEAEFQQQEAALAALQSEIQSLQQKLGSKNVVAVKDLPGIVVDDRQAKVVGDWQRSQSVKPYIGDGYLHDQDSGKGDKTITLLPELPKAGRYEVRLGYTPGDNRSDAVPVTVFSADGEKTVTVNQKQRPPIDNLFVSLGQYRFELNGQGFVIVSTAGTKGHVIVDAVQFLSVDELETPKTSGGDATTEASDQTERLQALQQELKEMQASAPKRPRYMSVEEEKNIRDLRIHIRGSVHTLGEPVARGFLQVIPIEDARSPAAAQSGRKELGEWLVHRDNSLTPRVLANRTWHWLFGAGLSRTPDNFGTTGEPPTHPELLDYLALRLLERNWAVKPLIRDVVCSRTYRQRSSATAAQNSVDPENRWLSHGNRRRLDAECLLDSILTISGRRNDQIGGSTIRPGTADDYGYVQQSTRRAVYWPVLRNSLPEMFEVFDFADPSTPSGSRNASTVAPQALFFLNDDWVAEEAKLAAERLLNLPFDSEEDRIAYAFQTSLGRSPTDSEVNLLLKTLSESDSAISAWTMLFQSLFATFDFRYLE